MEGTTLIKIFVASAILESVWETIKLAIYPGSRENLYNRLGTIFVGLFLAFSYGIDILGFLGLRDHIPYSGTILSGILISRGGNFIHDLILRLGNIKETLAVLTPVDLSSKSPDKIEPAVQVTKVEGI